MKTTSQKELASVKERVRLMMALLFRMDKKLPFVAGVYAAGLFLLLWYMQEASDRAAVSLAVAPLFESLFVVLLFAGLTVLTGVALAVCNLSLRAAARIGLGFALLFACVPELIQTAGGGQLDFTAILPGWLGAFGGYALLGIYQAMAFTGNWD